MFWKNLLPRSSKWHRMHPTSPPILYTSSQGPTQPSYFKMGSAHTSERLLNICQSTWHHSTEDHTCALWMLCKEMSVLTYSLTIYMITPKVNFRHSLWQWGGGGAHSIWRPCPSISDLNTSWIFTEFGTNTYKNFEQV